MGFLNKDLVHYIKILILFFVVYFLIKLIIYPYLRLRFLKQKYGDKVEIHFFPVAGFYSLFKAKKGCYDPVDQLNLQFKKRNPKVKVVVSHLVGKTYYSLLDPSLIKQFAQVQQKFKKYNDALFTDEMFEQALFFTHGIQWQRQRKYLSPLFSFDALKQRQEAINFHAQKLVQSIKSDLNVDSNDKRKLIRKIGKATGDIICHSFFGQEITEINLNNQSLSEELHSMIETLFRTHYDTPYICLRIMLFGYFTKKDTPSFLLLQKEKQIYQRIQNLRKVVEEIIKGRIEKFGKDEKENKYNDFLYFILKEYKKDAPLIEQYFQDNKTEPKYLTQEQQKEIKEKFTTLEEIIQQFIGMYAAGFDTTAHLLMMCLYYLGEYPEIQETIRKECRSKVSNPEQVTLEETKQFNVLSMFVYEVIRKSTPVPQSLLRESLENQTLDWLTILKGEYVDFQPSSSFRDDKFFPNYKDFDICRFKDLKLVESSGNFLPFFSGSHNCIGQHMALLETKIILFKIINKLQIVKKKGYKLVMEMNFLYQPVDKNIVDFIELK